MTEKKIAETTPENLQGRENGAMAGGGYSTAPDGCMFMVNAGMAGKTENSVLP
jgi:hypothetical protein